jgi:signal transduction histidine kinase
MRRWAPHMVAAGLGVLLLSYVIFTQRVVSTLREEASHTGRMFASVYAALSDTTADGGTRALFSLAAQVTARGVPVILTDADGEPTACANLPFCDPINRELARAEIPRLDAANAPIEGRDGLNTVHFGDPPMVRWMRVIPAIQAVTLAIFLLAALYLFRVRAHASREKLWAGLARESAHQLGTPLSSLSGWIELLSDRPHDELTASAVAHMTADMERLQRVANRFERIGRPPRREPVDVGELVRGCSAYFRARLPTLANSVTLVDDIPSGEAIIVQGDPVLLEWALESLIRNAVDALGGRGGKIEVSVEPIPEGGARVRVADDGPGIPRELRSAKRCCMSTAPCSCSPGAGSGKTRVLTTRIARLIDTQGCIPRAILA